MKKFYLFFVFVLIVLTIVGCKKEPKKELTYEITINESLETSFYVGSNQIDFKPYFIITNSKGDKIEVTDNMIDVSEVDFSKSGAYKVKLTYKGLFKELTINVNDITYEISINEDLSTVFYVGTNLIDFKPYFTISASNGGSIEVLDSMIDVSQVDLSSVGTYKVKLTYQNISKELTITVIKKTDKPVITYEIKINENLPTKFTMGTENVDFKSYFTITDSNGVNITVTDSMISSTVDFSNEGTYVVKVTFENQSKELTIEVEKAPELPTNSTDLFISEYLEGSDNNKYIELFNGTGENIDLTMYSIKLYANGAMEATFTYYLNGTLNDGRTYLIYNKNAGSHISSVGDVSHNVMNFNGNDCIVLLKDEIVIDVIGDMNNPVDSGWDINDISAATVDHTLIRKDSVTSPNNTWTPGEWNVLDKDDISNIKTHQMANYQPGDEDPDDKDPIDPIERTPDLYISEYFEGSGVYKDSKYIEIYNGLGTDIDLSTYALAIYKDGAQIPSDKQSLSGNLQAGEVYIVYSPYAHESIKAVGHLVSEVTYFNGKAAIALLKNDEVIDVIGVIGEYPQSGWIVDENSTTIDNVLIRKETINSPTTVWDPTEWYPCFENYLYGIGYHTQLDEENKVYEDFAEIFDLIKHLSLNDKGTATSDNKITVRGTVYMDVKSETSLVYLTDGKYIIKLHGEKIHNYTEPGVVYEVTVNFSSHIYQPSLTVENPTSDIIVLRDETPITTIEYKEVSLSEILSLKRENFVDNINNGYLQSLLKVTGYLHLDIHNSNKFDYVLTVKETYEKNDTGYIKDGLYYKNQIEFLEEYLIDYEVVLGQENVQVTIYGVLYEWNTNRKDWMMYMDEELTINNLQ